MQVEELTCKSRLLEAELETTSRQLMEATTAAQEETAKCVAAKEVIKSLTAEVSFLCTELYSMDTSIIRQCSCWTHVYYVFFRICNVLVC